MTLTIARLLLYTHRLNITDKLFVSKKLLRLNGIQVCRRELDHRTLIGSTCDGGGGILTTVSSSVSFSFLREEVEEDLERFPGR